MARKKKDSPSTINEFDGGLCYSWGEFFSDGYFTHFCRDDKWRKKLIDALVEFSKDRNNLFIIRFCQKYKIPRRTLTDIASRHPDVKDAYEHMKMVLACNRIEGVAYKQLDKAGALMGVHRLDPEIKEDMQFEVELNKKQEINPPSINVIMPKPDVTQKE